jgi:hypothetical protein
MLRTAFATITLLFLAASARATVIEVPVPGLLGPYPPSSTDYTRTTSIKLPAIPTVIHGVSLRISGTQAMGHLVCPLGTFQDWPMLFEASMEQDENHWWLAPYKPTDTSFTLTVQFDPSPPEDASWEFLMDGSGTIKLYGAPNFLEGPCWENPVAPAGEITDAVLIVDADVALPVEASTWGKIKGLYRR